MNGFIQQSRIQKNIHCVLRVETIVTENEESVISIFNRKSKQIFKVKKFEKV